MSRRKDPTRIPITFHFDEWASITSALADYASREKRPDLLLLNAAIERSIGLSASAAGSEAEADRLLG